MIYMFTNYYSSQKDFLIPIKLKITIINSVQIVYNFLYKFNRVFHPFFFLYESCITSIFK